jgi:hypothetical protein
MSKGHGAERIIVYSTKPYCQGRGTDLIMPELTCLLSSAGNCTPLNVSAKPVQALHHKAALTIPIYKYTPTLNIIHLCDTTYTPRCCSQ